MELRPQPTALEQCQVGGRAVGGIGPHIAGGVVAIEHRAELAAVISCRVGNDIAPQETVLAVDADMVLVPEHRHRDLRLALVAGSLIGRGLALAPALQCPASVAIDLRTPRRLPLGRHPAALDRVLLDLGQSRPARLDHRRIDDLTAHRQPALRA